uniref:Transposase n=1 Tax=Steinernema glaseri TaxID=37863 RepID=A0A1I7YBH9_9BILA
MELGKKEIMKRYLRNHALSPTEPLTHSSRIEGLNYTVDTKSKVSSIRHYFTLKVYGIVMGPMSVLLSFCPSQTKKHALYAINIPKAPI